MKRTSLFAKVGLIAAIVLSCDITNFFSSNIAQSQTFDFPIDSNPPKLPQPPIVFPPDGRFCDRLTNSICSGTPNRPIDIIIRKIDDQETQAICGYAGICPSTPTIDFESIQKEIQSSEQATGSPTALIYLDTFDNHVEIIIVPSSGKEIRKSVPLQDIGQKQSFLKEVSKIAANGDKPNLLMATVQDLLDSLQDSTSLDYLQPAQKLYNWLIRPIDQDLQAANIKTLIFVMNGPLRAIPIGVLHDGKQFLVQKYATATVPSMGLANLQIPDRRNSKILVMGLTQAKQGFSALPNVGVETNVITSKLLPDGGDLFLDDKFTIEILKNQQNKKDYGIVHIASHAQFLSNTSKGAFIQFWNQTLSLDDLRTLRSGKERIDMLTLSACQTAVGKNLGLSGTALIYGANSVLASLWSVSDAGTTPLMLSFYNYYPKAKSKAIAIQQAQLDLLEGRVRIESDQIKGISNLPSISLSQTTGDIDLKHPYFWASFILVGNWL
jgi:CHAT domain-containing protein